MADVLVTTGRRVRRWRTASEKLAIVQLTLRPGASVAEVARAQGMNANQLFKWRRAFERGELAESSLALIPVKVSNSEEEKRAPEEVVPAAGGAIHIELPGRAVISVERGAGAVPLGSSLESYAASMGSATRRSTGGRRSMAA